MQIKNTQYFENESRNFWPNREKYIQEKNLFSLISVKTILNFFLDAITDFDISHPGSLQMK